MRKIVCMILTLTVLLSLGVPAFALEAACQHTYGKTTTARDQVDCHVQEVQKYRICTKCGWVDMIEEYTLTNNIHLGPYYYENETLDGIDYRCKYCRNCGDLVSKSRV